MARRCQVTGVGPLTGNTRSHAMNASKRKFNVNLQKIRVVLDGRKVTLRVSAKGLKTLKLKGIV
ncbi:50S ribosomal protein L28 [Mycoplasmopsis felis]|uniref:Large ribosomal subunit protein bL28 n=1 Tax=Mycoplasmopsis felis TaxID=33923 RepID=A0A809S057_9BACT|nr:50S ribosomal protein L28 [Mycoplasmopsis felis]WQQ01851.1 50S ribosomal protein L28 [Mycoplasmopsis felis]WQQ02289.1 50S ribosomal protein L28 [Mycoplasmopsis felis]WQQ03357.1 50S ribosomal protein L28 [Mycoplasmopsis felis]WQQ03632.1 50S ribosomal protein L28 [Mycoplasmopsis felis]WQQ05001.1 50S ribosomal protein L28 [Mycoplasmopsis felis]